MKIGVKILLSYLIVFGIGFFYLINWVLGDLRLRYLEGVEEALVDQATVMAALINDEMETGRYDKERLHGIFDLANSTAIAADIYRLRKESVDLQMYITDADGRVVFHSEDPSEEGKDYSKWRDVHLTLSGEYGARTTRKHSRDPLSTSMYVAAPLGPATAPTGVLTLVKPTYNINKFVAFAKIKVIKVGFLAAGAVALAGIFTTYWFTRPIRRLTQYADDVRQKRRVPLPRLDGSEIGVMGKAFERMRQALEGKKYVEQYVQTFTHEIKSPLSAIRGAAELLEESMPEKERKHFLANIRNESLRIQHIVDRLLRLTSLESRQTLGKIKKVLLHPLVTELAGAAEPVLEKRRISIQCSVDKDHAVQGDAFLLKQTISNLLQNAIEFSLEDGKISLVSRETDSRIELIIEDSGVGIPEFARDRIFDKFFSLERPDNHRKSTGLGLNFVKEAVNLHGGGIRFESRESGGTRAILSLKRIIE